jgi:hypothetical protein
MRNVEVKEKKTIKAPGVTNFYLGIAIDIILLYAFNNIRYLNISILLTDNYVSCLWAINLALGMGIIGNFILLLYRPLWYYHLTQFVINILVVLAFYVFYHMFPLNFSQDIIQTAINIVLILIMIGVGIGAIVDLVRCFIAYIHREKSFPSPVSPAVSKPPLASDSVPGTTSLPEEHSNPHESSSEGPSNQH